MGLITKCIRESRAITAQDTLSEALRLHRSITGEHDPQVPYEDVAQKMIEAGIMELSTVSLPDRHDKFELKNSEVRERVERVNEQYEKLRDHLVTAKLHSFMMEADGLPTYGATEAIGEILDQIDLINRNQVTAAEAVLFQEPGGQKKNA